jgi:hypothetical protein
MLLEDNRTSTDEAYAGDYLRGYSRWIERGFAEFRENGPESILRDNHEQGTAQGYQKMGTEACFLGSVLAFQANSSTKQGSYKETKDKFSCHISPYLLR